jgi:hypothetical protein
MASAASCLKTKIHGEQMDRLKKFDSYEYMCVCVLLVKSLI